MSKIEVDAIEPQSGTSLTLGASGDTITIPSGATLTNSGTATGFGKVLQVVSTTKTDTFTTSSTSLTDVTGMSASITPSSASNKILVLSSLTYGSNNYNAHGILLRGATEIAKATAGTNPTTFAMSGNNSQSFAIYCHSISHLDSPSTTSATTYKVQVKVQSGGTFYLNQSDRDNSDDLRGVSTLTLLEIAG
jgi:hypothetical protein